MKLPVTFRNGSKQASVTGMASRLSSRRSRPTTVELLEIMANSYSDGGENSSSAALPTVTRRAECGARLRWLKARERELLPTRYVHAVFTLPRELAPLALQNKRLIYNLLFHSSAETLLEVARDPRHLGAEIGFFSVLHSWNQRLQFHPH